MTNKSAYEDGLEDLKIAMQNFMETMINLRDNYSKQDLGRMMDKIAKDPTIMALEDELEELAK